VGRRICTEESIGWTKARIMGQGLHTMRCPGELRAISHGVLMDNPMKPDSQSSLHKRSAKIREVSTENEVTELGAEAGSLEPGWPLISLNLKTGSSCASYYIVCF
jgi:hypothetical protein